MLAKSNESIIQNKHFRKLFLSMNKTKWIGVIDLRVSLSWQRAKIMREDLIGTEELAPMCHCPHCQTINIRSNCECVRRRKHGPLKTRTDLQYIIHPFLMHFSALSLSSTVPSNTNESTWQIAWAFLKMGHSRPLFLYFRLFNTVDRIQICSL